MKKGTTKYNLIGQRFGKLTVLECLGTDEKYHLYWKCVCDCGKETRTRNQNLLQGKSKSCGCGDLQRKREQAFRLKISNTKNPTDVAERYVFNLYCKEARKRKLEFDLSPSDVIHLMYQNCFYCKTVPENVYKVIRHGETIPVRYSGIDRIDSSKGYVLGNVVSCCKHCNFAKNNMKIDEFREWIKRIYTNFVTN